MKYKVIIILLLVIPTIILSCSTNNKRRAEKSFILPDSLEDVPSQLHEEAMAGIIGNLASPVEVAAMLNELGVPFYQQLPASTNKVNNLQTNFEKALALGALGADLGYLNIYNKNTRIIDYISSIKYLTDELNVGQFFDFNTLKRLCENKHMLDSLMFQSVYSFNQMNTFLEKTGRRNTSTLVVTGLWLEGFYIATQISKSDPKPELIESIGEQKIILKDLFSLLENYEDDSTFKELYQSLERLTKIYEGVEITYETGEPETFENEDGMLEIIQNEKSIVHISIEQVERIIKETEKIRNQFINL